MPTVFERVRKIIVEQLGVDEEEVVPTASFVDDLNADSLDLVELIMTMEEEFGSEDNPVEISDEDAEKIVTVQDAVDYIKDRGIDDTPYGVVHTKMQVSGGRSCISYRPPVV